MTTRIKGGSCCRVSESKKAALGTEQGGFEKMAWVLQRNNSRGKGAE